MPDDDLSLLRRAAETCGRVRDEVGRVVLGQNETISVLLATLLAGGHALIEGVPGVAKTLMVRTLAQALGWSFGRVQFTPDTMPSDVIGAELASPGSGTRFVQGPIFANFVLADELNRATSRAQAALLEAMEEGRVTVAGKTHPLPRPFHVLATQNPREQLGTNPLPEAQLDRFMVGITVAYPRFRDEERMVNQTTGEDAAPINAVPGAAEFALFADLLDRMPLTDFTARYAVTLARATRPEGSHVSGVAVGAGPRAATHLLRLSKALALLDDMPTPTAEHVRRAAGLVLPHRIILTPAARMTGFDTSAFIAEILARTPEPGDE